MSIQVSNKCVLLAIVLICMLMGCDSYERAGNHQDNAQDTYPSDIQDTGHNIHKKNLAALKKPLAQTPQRMISLAPHITELLYSLGMQDKLVGVVEYSDYPNAAKKLTRIGDAFALDWEQLIALQPDLVIGWQGGNPPAVLDKIEEQGFNLLRMENASLRQLPVQLKKLADLMGAEVNVDAIGRQYLQDLSDLQKNFSGKKKVHVFYQISSEPIYTVDGQHVISDMLNLCGGVNVFPALGKTSAPVTPEAVLAARPDVILTSVYSLEHIVDQWDGMFSADNIIAIPAETVSRASLRMRDGVKNICEGLDEWRNRRAAD